MSPTTPDFLNSKTFEKITLSLLTRFHVPGISISLVHDTKTTAKGFGHATLPSTPATANTIYYAASTTKSFTTALLALLMSDSANTANPISWQTPISTLIRDDFLLSDPYATEHATLEDAACHRIGIPGHDFAYGGPGSTVRDVVRTMRHLPFTAPFRTKRQYSNLGYIALSHVAETISRRPLAELFRVRIWEPLGMNHTYASLSAAKETTHNDKGHRLATGYTWDTTSASVIETPYLDAPELAGAACNISTAPDYAKYLTTLLSQSAPLLPAAHTALRAGTIPMHSDDEVTPFTGPKSYGLGWQHDVYRGVKLQFHTGGAPGFGAVMAFVPELGVGFTGLGNNLIGGHAVGLVLFVLILDWILDGVGGGVGEGKEEEEVVGGNLDRHTDVLARLDTQSRDFYTRDPDEIRVKLYPSIPSPPIPPSLPIAAYTGTYTSPGYQSLTLHTTTNYTPTTHQTTPTTILLRSEAQHRTWPFALDLQHVSGDNFIAWVARVRGGTEPLGEGNGLRVEFRVDMDGRAVRVGVGFGGGVVWFVREC